MAYYFLAASLPTLVMDESSEMTGEEFLAMCEGNVDAVDYEDLRAVTNREPERAKHPFVREWMGRETLLRNAVARIRAANSGVEADSFLKDTDFFETEPAEMASDIMRGGNESRDESESSPLERELALDRYRWKTLDEMAEFDQFDMPALLAFAFKLQLAKRWSTLKKKEGRAAIGGFIDKSLKQKE